MNTAKLTRLFGPSLLAILLALIAAPSALAIDVWNYWLMPHGLVANFQNETWNNQTRFGQHCFWRGNQWGRTVALQGDPSMTKYDIFVLNGSVLDYWATFRGNGASNPISHTFDAPFHWMSSNMGVGQAVENAFTIRVFDPRLRKQASSATVTMRLTIDAHYPSWTLPETGVTYQDVLKITFLSDKNNPSSKEIYHLGRGKGTLRFESSNSGEPSGIRKAWATSFVNRSIQSPTLPWFDPFVTSGGKKPAVLNGLFEERTSSANGASINTSLPRWSSLSSDGVITTDPPNTGDSGGWKIALKGTSGGGDGLADAVTSDWIPVAGGGTYRLSGYLWRVSSSDNVYLDFNDGIAQGTNFGDVQALATTTNRWQHRTATVTLPAGTSQIKVRAVRDGANAGNAYFEGITLQRVN